MAAGQLLFALGLTVYCLVIRSKVKKGLLGEMDGYSLGAEGAAGVGGRGLSGEAEAPMKSM